MQKIIQFHHNFPLLLLFLLVIFSEKCKAEGDMLADVSKNLPPEQVYFMNRTIINRFLYQPSTTAADTPYVIRYVLVQLICAYDISTACVPNSLSFLGKRLSIPPSICSSIREQAHAILILTYRVLLSEFPDEAASLFVLLDHLNLIASINFASDAWVNEHTKSLLKFLSNDGWNSPSYADTTNYRPFNDPGSPPNKLKRPLRWQPLSNYQSRGRFTSQVHVFPHIGRTVKPLSLSDSDFHQTKRRAISPYKRPFSRNKIRRSDTMLLNKLAMETMKKSDNATPQDHAMAIWWDSKLASTGIINLAYARFMKLKFPEAFVFLLGDMIAQHDAVILAWREKRRHDLVRPQGIIRRLINPNWTPLLAAQPHSEFPSASAIICTASLQHASAFANNKGINLPVFKGSTAKSVFNPKSVGAFTVTIENPEQGARMCGDSRVMAGVHFQPAVEAGFEISQGIGKIAFNHMRQLYEGSVPASCHRCNKF